ncbi:MAG: Sigma factor-binding protein Crl [Candidatus Erwinia impunctatus]|nr:Sigma factor-binding protein Crl [Culicoides impunctatus]
MVLPSGHSRGRLVARFTALGPYLREEKCSENRFFFDCLAVCVNVKPAPELREFWGWWIELEVLSDHCRYTHHTGLFDKQGEWQVTEVKGKNTSQRLQETWQQFHQHLQSSLQDLDLNLIPASEKNADSSAMTTTEKNNLS